MAQPPAYTPAYDFTDFQATNPADPLPANKVDAEYAAIKATFDATLANLSLLQRDDTKLKNLIVHPESLDAATRALMVADWTPRGAWGTGAIYAVKDVVEQGGVTYIAALAHTAGVFATDLAAGKWLLLGRPAQTGPGLWCAVGGTADAIALTPPGPLVAYEAGQTFRFTAASTSTIAGVTVDVLALGAKALKRRDSSALAVGDVKAGAVYDVVYDGTDFRLLSGGLNANDLGGAAADLAAIIAKLNGATGQFDGAQVTPTGDPAAQTLAALLAERVVRYDDKSVLQAKDVPAAVDAVRLDGAASAGDGKAALYKRAASEPAQPEAVQSADGAWWAKVYDRATRPQRFETAGDDTVLREVVAAGGEYKAFPAMARTATGRLVAAYWHGTAHSPSVTGGNGKGQIEVVYSDDGGATWSSPEAVYGNVDNGDPQYAYFLACGNDRHGNVVLILGIFDGASYVRPHITRSEDGVSWSTPVEMAVTGSADVTVGTLIPFGTIHLLPSGKMVLAVYQADFNWAGVIDDDVSETTLDLTSKIVESSSPAYSECALCPITELEWLAFLRQDGGTNAIPTYRTTDGGATWTSLGDTGLPVTGGYVVQAAFPFEIGGLTHIGLLTGIRKSASLPPTGSPGVLFAATSYKDLMASGDPQFRRRHVWPMADDGQIRDAYVGIVFDPVTHSLAIITHEETGEFTSRILAGAVNVGSALNGQPEQVRRAWTPVLTGTTVTGTNIYSVQAAHYSEVGDWVDYYFRIEITTLASEGNLQVEGWPYGFADEQEMIIQTATGLGASIERLILRPTVNTTVAPILERSGTSFFAHTEVSGTLVLRCTGRYRKYVEGA